MRAPTGSDSTWKPFFEIVAHGGVGAVPVGLGGRGGDSRLIGRGEALGNAARIFIEGPVGVAGGLGVGGVEEDRLLLRDGTRCYEDQKGDQENRETALIHLSSIHSFSLVVWY